MKNLTTQPFVDLKKGVEESWEIKFRDMVLDYYMNCGSRGFNEANPKYEKMVNFIQSEKKKSFQEGRESVDVGI